MLNLIKVTFLGGEAREFGVEAFPLSPPLDETLELATLDEVEVMMIVLMQVFVTMASHLPLPALTYIYIQSSHRSLGSCDEVVYYTMQ